MAKTWYRPAPRQKGVYQRCTEACPPKGERCRTHTFSWRFEASAGANGKRRQFGKDGYKSVKDAAEARAETVRRHATGTLPSDTKKTLGEWLPEWLDGKIKRDEIEDTTARGYADNIKNHLVPKLGHRKLAELRGLDITRAYAEIQRERREEIAAAEAKNKIHKDEAERVNAKRKAAGKIRMVAPKRVAVPRPISSASVARIHACLSGSLKSAVKAGLIPRNVAMDAELPRVDRHKVTPPEPEQYAALLDRIVNERLFPLVVVAGYSGLRRGELAGLKWEDVSLKTGRLVVRRQRVSVGYQVVEREAKTEAGQDRVVYLDADARKDLSAWRAKQAKERLAWGTDYHDAGYIFTREDGTPYHPDYITKVVSRLLRRANIPAAKLHALRHFRAAWLISMGTDIAVVSKTLGHKSIAITSDIYGSLQEQAAMDLAKKTRGYVARGRTA
ncbi:tyrosine-type recombinase/integrase [Asanoa sp. WMMD1127]|uniref:tyrosine-type recombinase/integrase n=1 Tax=Asanoa sp. WMMD1127 TaxID=3016107 RepID=UPI0024166A33|nr:site-specific integrase [Asanoa sp. WMMD1127]MDG4821898.1 tyrosine-type recombinase/integrase [Asanoa sp. WMMD1127]